MDTFTILFTAVLGGIIFYLWRTMIFFKNSGIPYESPLPLIGNMASVLLRKEHFVHKVNNIYNKWPDAKYVGFYDFITPVILIRDIDLIKDIAIKHFDYFPNHRSFVDENADPLFGKSLFSLKDDKWKEVRNMLSPAFTSNKMRQMTELMVACAKDTVSYIVKDVKGGSMDLDIKSVFTKYTNDVIATCAFGISVNSIKDPDNDFYVMGRNATMFGVIKGLKVFFIRMCPTLAGMLNIKIFGEKINQFFLNIIKTTIETRKEKNICRPDMIQLMIESKEKNSNFKLSLVDMTAQAFIFFIGGFDTSSALMSFAAVVLTVNPDIQNKLIAEIDEVMKNSNGNPTYDQINSMPYLEAVLYETLRYFPIAGFTDRICTKSFELPPPVDGADPYTVQPGTNVWFPIQAIHQDPKYYDEPEKFHPDRFLNQKVAKSSPTFLSFGIGPRACIGNRFALIENKLILFHLLSKCRLEKSVKLKEPIEISRSSITIVIDGGFWVKIIPRDCSCN